MSHFSLDLHLFVEVSRVGEAEDDALCVIGADSCDSFGGDDVAPVSGEGATGTS